MTTRKICPDCKIRSIAPAGTDAYGVDLCNPCYDYAGWENTHSDYGHDSLTMIEDPDDDQAAEMALCQVCHPELDPRISAQAPRTGHTNTADTSGTRIDHSACAHPRTPKGRAGCRASGGPTIVQAPVIDPEVAVRDHSACDHSARGNGACVGRRLRALAKA